MRVVSRSRLHMALQRSSVRIRRSSENCVTFTPASRRKSSYIRETARVAFRRSKQAHSVSNSLRALAFIRHPQALLPSGPCSRESEYARNYNRVLSTIGAYTYIYKASLREPASAVRKENNPMRQLQLVAHGEPSDVIQLATTPEQTLGQEDVLVSMEAAPVNPSDFLFVRGIYGIRPAFPSSLGAEGVGRIAKTGSEIDVALRGKRALILPAYERGTWADQVVVPVRNIVPMSDEADPLQLSMIGINPATAYLLLN